MQSALQKSVSYILIFLALGVLWSASGNAAYSQDNNLRDLADIYQTGFILVDTDGDSLPDAVNVHLVLPHEATTAQITGAANIAARLGYETTAMDLDLVTFTSGLEEPMQKPAILFGEAGTGPDRDLAPGQGNISWIEPGQRFMKGAIQLTGSDATGLIAAAGYLSSRYPDLQKPGSANFSRLKNRIQEAASVDSLSLSNLRLEEIRIDGSKEGVASASLSMNVGSASAYDFISTLDEKEDIYKRWISDIVRDGIYRVDLIVQYRDQQARVRLVAEDSQPARREETSTSNADFDLQELYTAGGLYRDTGKDGVPDDMSGYISYSGQKSAAALVKFAARIGLETAGIRLPLVYAAGEDDHPEDKGFPILVGTNHYAATKLKEKGKRFMDIGHPGNGTIEFVENAFDETNALVITGNGEDGLNAALEYASGRLPYLWNYGKGNWKLDEVQTDVRRFFQGVEGPGQVAAGLEKLHTWFERMGDRSPDTMEVELSAQKVPEGLQEHISTIATEYFPDARVQVETYQTGFGTGKPIFEEKVEIPWEVDEFWLYMDGTLLPRIKPGSTGMIRIRISETPEIRRKIYQQLMERLSLKGLTEKDIEVQVLPAYKQGFGWLKEVILPELKGKDVQKVNISYYNLRDSDEIKWQATDSDTRWLQEIYPIDGVFIRALNIPDSAITFQPVYRGDPTYRVEAVDAGGREILRATFSPKYTVRPFFDLFPNYDSVRVTTGGVEAVINGKKIADRRIKTDLERFWNYLQQDTYNKILEYVMDIQDGRPESGLAPYFDEFRLDVTLSEPNYPLDILKEQITPLEALHEDIYFETLLFFRLIGNRYGAGSLSYPGRILPYVMPPEHGKPGRVHISLTGKERARPEVKLRYRGGNGQPRELDYELPNLRTEDPALRGIGVTGSESRLASLLFDIPVDRDQNPWHKFKQRGSEAYIDRNFVSAERLSGMIEALRQLQQKGMFGQVLSYDRVDELRFRFTREDSSDYSHIVALPQSSRPRNTERKPLIDSGFTYNGQNLVQWKRPIPPSENHRIISQLGTFDTINPYYMATSLLGHDVYVLDILPPTPSKYRSQAKMNALKPTLFISGRQHANEFSSTSHMLKLAEKVATEPEYRKYLEKVNLVLHPMTNPDGAELAVKLHNINPTFMHHAGYLGPLGVDITRDQGDRDPRYEVANVRDEIGETWLPDIFINMHGYPPHEWVQYFAGYSAWMMDRERDPGSNNYWIPRGYFLTGFSWYDHEEFPKNQALSFALLDSITTAVNAIPEMKQVNDEMQARYRKYRSHEEGYGEFYRNGMWVNAPLRGRESTGRGFRDPNITYFTLTSEAPDEPARGDWMEMNAAAGLAHSTAILDYLYYGVNRVKHEAEVKGVRVARKVYRIKPVLPESLLKSKR